jgi:hypothetical protein
VIEVSVSVRLHRSPAGVNGAVGGLGAVGEAIDDGGAVDEEDRLQPSSVSSNVATTKRLIAV